MISWLFVPGNKPQMLARAGERGADALILDLEDSVPDAEKKSARTMVRAALAHASQRGSAAWVRVNGYASGLTDEDVEAAITPDTYGICLPKSVSAEEVQRLDARLGEIEPRAGLPRGQVKICVFVETARGLLNAYALVTASARVTAAVFGADDFALSVGVQRTRAGTELLYARSHFVTAAHAAGILAIDAVYINYQDADGFIEEAQRARELGFDGKTLVHPNQIPLLHRVFAPTAEEIAFAQRVLAAYAQAEARGLGAIGMDGMMVDKPLVERARRILRQENS
jgi:citrate lyase subunit beta/citryl-CoA lyase